MFTCGAQLCYRRIWSGISADGVMRFQNPTTFWNYCLQYHLSLLLYCETSLWIYWVLVPVDVASSQQLVPSEVQSACLLVGEWWPRTLIILYRNWFAGFKATEIENNIAVTVHDCITAEMETILSSIGWNSACNPRFASVYLFFVVLGTKLGLRTILTVEI